MYDQSAESVRDALLVGWIYRHGIPTVLITDQGKNVDGRTVRELCTEYGNREKDHPHIIPQEMGRQIGRKGNSEHETVTPFPTRRTGG